jgi:hypothetical protein
MCGLPAAWRRQTMVAILLIPAIVLSLGCEHGKVDQGRVIGFDRETRAVTLIRDAGDGRGDPEYSCLPPVVFTLPDDPAETGPVPRAGLRMKLDTAKNEITIFDAVSGGFKKIRYTLIDQKESVERTDPLVYDYFLKSAKRFPVVDRDRKMITVYSPRQKTVTMFSLPDEYFTLSDITWTLGDEVRIYYKEKGKALRFMNVTRTGIYRE